MKTIKISLFTAIVSFLFIVASCKKENVTQPINSDLALSITGTYSGQLTNSNTNQTQAATLIASSINDSMVNIQCTSIGFDTTITYRLYQNKEKVMMCFTGDDFYNEYGRYLNNNDFCNSKSQNWNNGSCMNNNCWGGNDQWNAWTNHKNSQHIQSDLHYGEFNVNSKSCSYNFQINDGSSSYTQSFVGKR